MYSANMPNDVSNQKSITIPALEYEELKAVLFTLI